MPCKEQYVTSSSGGGKSTFSVRRVRRSPFDYFKSPDFPIHLMCYWWLLWLAISCTDLNQFTTPSPATMAQYLLLIASFYIGHLLVKIYRPFNAMQSKHFYRPLQSDSARVKGAIRISVIGCTLMLLISLKLSGAFDVSFIDYFALVRIGLAKDSTATVTGIHTLDVLTKILAFPLSYTMIVTILGAEIKAFKILLVVSVINLICFSYLWQVNYPFIHCFWLLIFYILLIGQRKNAFNKKIIVSLAVLFVVLLASAANRVGGDVLGGFQRYIFGYHLLGFSYYDHQYSDPTSILHSHTFGRSSLGFLDQALEQFFKSIGTTYRSASLENAEFNERNVDLGATDVLEFNAFGTILFGLYRDFNVIGIALGGLVYGVVVTLARYKSAQSWVSGALFLLLAAAWMMGMMVDPIEEAYFWWIIVALYIFSIFNRGLKW
jgi:oligosaccharide repeat unit polymerase